MTSLFLLFISNFGSKISLPKFSPLRSWDVYHDLSFSFSSDKPIYLVSTANLALEFGKTNQRNWRNQPLWLSIEEVRKTRRDAVSFDKTRNQVNIQSIC